MAAAKTAAELLAEAVEAMRNAQACPPGRHEAYALGRRVQRTRSRYAQAAGMSEKDADLIIRKRAEHAERFNCTAETPCQYHADAARTRTAGRTYHD